MNAIKLNHENGSIVITKDYAKKSSIPNSKEYKELIEIKKAYRDYAVVVRKTAKRKSKTNKITLSNMRTYISNHDKDGTIMSDFEKIVKESDNSIEYRGFFGIKKWFLEHYSELKNEA